MTLDDTRNQPNIPQSGDSADQLIRCAIGQLVHGATRPYHARTVSAASSAATSGVSVLPVRSAAERRRFIRFPWTVYRDIDAWVPPLISDFKNKLDTVRNPFYEHAEIELFLARRNGAVAGTVAAIIDHHYKQFSRRAHRLLRLLRGGQRRRGGGRADRRRRGVGERARHGAAARDRSNPSTAESMGILLDAYDRPPAIMMAYNPALLPAAAGEHRTEQGQGTWWRCTWRSRRRRCRRRWRAWPSWCAAVTT